MKKAIMMLIEDHINLQALLLLAFKKCKVEFGSRFHDMSNPYVIQACEKIT